MARGQKKWDDAQEEELRELIKSGLSVSKIAEKMERSLGSIIQKSSLLGIRREITKEDDFRFDWNANDVQRLQELCFVEKLPISQIAKQMGRSEASISAKMWRIGAFKNVDDEGEDGEPSQATLRKCLTCRVSFMSEWKGTRICLQCKNREEYRCA